MTKASLHLHQASGLMWEGLENKGPGIYDPDIQDQLTRRNFLATTAAAAAGSVASASALHAESKSTTVVDTHLHCFAGNKDPRFPYHPKAPYQPEREATPQHLLACMDEAGVDYAVVVHPEPYQDDHRYLEYCLEVGKGRLKGSCLFFADRPGSVEKMPDLVKRADIVTARIHAYAPGRMPPFGKPQLRALWKQASDLGLAIQLHFEPRFAPPFENLIREFPDTPVIIDHLGRPMQGTIEEHAAIVKWSNYPNTVMKLSSIPNTRNYPHRDGRPVIRQLVDAWGPERLIYGGGFGASATGESYRAYREKVRSNLTHLSAEDQAKVLGGNAASLFQWS